MKKYQETINLREKGEASARNKRSDLSKRHSRGRLFFSDKLMERSDLLFLVLAVILVVILAGFWVFFHRDSDEAGWYAVKLINEEIYYGQIADLSADPVALSDVYFYMEQLNEDSKVLAAIRENEL